MFCGPLVMLVVMERIMKTSIIPLWITLHRLNMQYSLQPCDIDNKQQTQGGILGYEIFGIGKLSRTIELNITSKNHSDIKKERFETLPVSLRSSVSSEKYSGEFLYLEDETEQTNQSFGTNPLCLYLYVPATKFDKFCENIQSTKIHNLEVGINLLAAEEAGVGRFGPPSVDDIIYINAKSGCFDPEIKLFSIKANIDIQESTKVDQEIK
jgi:hypothetical protein